MKPIGGITLEESVKALQDVFMDHNLAEKGEPMRLIDADSLETHEIYEGEWVRVVYADDIDNAPTVEAEPVRHGKWIITSEFEDCCYAKCNQCNITQVFYFNKRLTDFCPNCGAKMDGERRTGSE